MKDRRNFLKLTSFAAVGMITAPSCQGKSLNEESEIKNIKFPVIISTWNHGMAANAKALEVLKAGGSSLDAVEQGVRVVESDPTKTSVGYGGLPDREGKVTLDASIMNHNSHCGSVAFLQNIENPITVARQVMEKTPHVMLVGKGAYQFARAQGAPHKDLLTAESKAAYQEWLKTSKYKPIVNIENHDTIGTLAIDSKGRIAGACTTSGMAYKLHGRVGDSPLIGPGLFLHGEVGGAVATGVGEAIIRAGGCALVVEAMRHGKSPQEACEEIVNRIITIHPDAKDTQASFIAMNKYGEVGAFSIYSGFDYAYTTSEKHEMVLSPFNIKYTKK